jgi:hypothetical protein
MSRPSNILKRLLPPKAQPIEIWSVKPRGSSFSFEIRNASEVDRYIDKIWLCVGNAQGYETLQHLPVESVVFSDDKLKLNVKTDINKIKAIQFLSMAQVATYDARYRKVPKGKYFYNHPLPYIATNDPEHITPIDVPLLAANINASSCICMRPYLRYKTPLIEKAIGLYEIIYAAYSSTRLAESWALELKCSFMRNDLVKGMLYRTFEPSIDTIQLLGLYSSLGETPLNAVLSRAEDGKLHYNRGIQIPLLTSRGPR